MNILYLGNENKRIINYLNRKNHIVFVRQSQILNEEIANDIDYVISYGYRFLISPQIIERFKNKAINLHISYLPWNRGADPNLWSFLEDTPKGVTIHYLDYKLDNGDILGQSLIEYNEKDTLRTTYERLMKKMEDLFIEVWEAIEINKTKLVEKTSKGTYHCLKDKEKFLFLLKDGWDTKVIDIIGKAGDGIDD